MHYIRHRKSRWKIAGQRTTARDAVGGPAGRSDAEVVTVERSPSLPLSAMADVAGNALISAFTGAARPGSRRPKRARAAWRVHKAGPRRAFGALTRLCDATAFWSPPASPGASSFPGADAITTAAAAEPLFAPSLFVSPRGASAAVTAALYGFGMPPPQQRAAAAFEPAAPPPDWSRLTKRRCALGASCDVSAPLLAALRDAPTGRAGRKGADATLARKAAPSPGPAPAATKLGKRKAAHSA